MVFFYKTIFHSTSGMQRKSLFRLWELFWLSFYILRQTWLVYGRRYFTYCRKLFNNIINYLKLRHPCRGALTLKIFLILQLKYRGSMVSKPLQSFVEAEWASASWDGDDRWDKQLWNTVSAWIPTLLGSRRSCLTQRQNTYVSSDEEYSDTESAAVSSC